MKCKVINLAIIYLLIISIIPINVLAQEEDINGDFILSQEEPLPLNQEELSFYRKINLPYIRGDANRDGNKDLSDAVFILNYLFLGGPPSMCDRSMDVDKSGNTDLTDAIFYLNSLFLGGESLDEKPIEPEVCEFHPNENKLVLVFDDPEKPFYKDADYTDPDFILRMMNIAKDVRRARQLLRELFQDVHILKSPGTDRLTIESCPGAGECPWLGPDGSPTIDGDIYDQDGKYVGNVHDGGFGRPGYVPRRFEPGLENEYLPLWQPYETENDEGTLVEGELGTLMVDIESVPIPEVSIDNYRNLEEEINNDGDIAIAGGISVLTLTSEGTVSTAIFEGVKETVLAGSVILASPEACAVAGAATMGLMVILGAELLNDYLAEKCLHATITSTASLELLLSEANVNPIDPLPNPPDLWDKLRKLEPRKVGPNNREKYKTLLKIIGTEKTVYEALDQGKDLIEFADELIRADNFAGAADKVIEAADFIAQVDRLSGLEESIDFLNLMNSAGNLREAADLAQAGQIEQAADLAGQALRVLQELEIDLTKEIGNSLIKLKDIINAAQYLDGTLLESEMIKEMGRELDAILANDRIKEKAINQAVDIFEDHELDFEEREAVYRALDEFHENMKEAYEEIMDDLEGLNMEMDLWNPFDKDFDPEEFFGLYIDQKIPLMIPVDPNGEAELPQEVIDEIRGLLRDNLPVGVGGNNPPEEPPPEEEDGYWEREAANDITPLPGFTNQASGCYEEDGVYPTNILDHQILMYNPFETESRAAQYPYGEDLQSEEALEACCEDLQPWIDVGMMWGEDGCVEKIGECVGHCPPVDPPRNSLPAICAHGVQDGFKSECEFNFVNIYSVIENQGCPDCVARWREQHGIDIGILPVALVPACKQRASGKCIQHCLNDPAPNTVWPPI